MKWKAFKERLLNWFFPGLVSMRNATRDLQECNLRLRLIVRALGTCPDCEKKLGDCSCKKGVIE